MRLINADSLIKNIEAKVDIQDLYSPMHIIQLIYQEPTVKIEELNKDEKYIRGYDDGFQVLPKGHGDLISREALRRSFIDNDVDDFGLIGNAPTVEPETKVVANVTFNKEQMEELVEKAKADILAQIERPQGEWTYIGNTTISHSIKICECNQCKQRIYGAHNFCGNCGAKMKGGAE